MDRINTTSIAAIFYSALIGFIAAIASHYFRDWIVKISIFAEERLAFDSMFLYFLISLCVAACIVHGIRKLANINRFEGPADSIFAAHRVDNELNIKHGFYSTLAAFSSAAGGASVGQYGPLVHLGATIGAWIKEKSKSGLSTDIFIGCGVSAAISAGFTAPIAGVIFAHEAITRHFSLRALAPISISSGIAYLCSELLWSTELPLQQVTEISEESFNLTLIFTLIVAPIFGIAAFIFMKSLEKLASLNQKIKLSQIYKTTCAIFILSTIGSLLPEVMGLGTGVIALTVSGQYTLIMLVLLFFGKLVTTTISLSFGFFGGVFSPALFLGASLGALLAHLLNLLGMTEISYQTLSVCGMASVAGAVIGAPIAAVLIVFELTQSYQMGLAALLSVVIALMVSNAIYGQSYFDNQLLKRGIDLSFGRTGLVLMETQIFQFTSQNFVTVSKTTTVKQVLENMIKQNQSDAYVVDSSNSLIGKLEMKELITRSPSEEALPYADREPISIKKDASLQQAIEVAATFVGESIPVVDRKNNQLCGILTEGDIFSEYLRLQNEIIDLEKR